MKGIVLSLKDTEINDPPSAFGSSALLVEGEVKELNLMLKKMLRRLELGNKPLGSKFSGGNAQGSKRKSGCWNCGSANHFN